ncbi:GIY-YIG nuclease family protein [Sphingomonas lenta]|uniref:Endonuclease n=1 Tax=Sphingomonas lenta TaxID=1141887 RepID=A0A2A2SCW2_9SPHN|nr:GIY-YIG nuclease family protein [Sphingomonas lenta]PAX07045.1 endonuclease [Sphingomonas lenta]
MTPQPMFYILTNQKQGALYAGVTRWPMQRIHQHRTGIIEGFSKRYGTAYLIYFELFEAIVDAISREKQIKNWRRAWKVELIEKSNPTWRDLALDLGFAPVCEPRWTRMDPGAGFPARYYFAGVP